MRRVFIFIVLLVNLTPSVVSADDSLAYDALARQAAFAVELLGALESQKAENLIISPLSLSTALSIACAGAKGTTRQEITDALHSRLECGESTTWYSSLTSKGPRDADTEFLLANGMWIQEGYQIESAFREEVKNDYHSELATLDFTRSRSAVDTINTWISDQTKNQIRNVVKALHSNTRLALANAIYFKAKWSEPFNKRLTELAPFYLASGGSKGVMMMRNWEGNAEEMLPYLDTETAQWVAVPYRGGRFSFVIILPTSVDGLTAFEKRLTGAVLSQGLRDLFFERNSHSFVRLSMPRFAFEYTAGSIRESLERLGIRDAFDGARADFGGITSAERLVIDKIAHKARIELDEEGTVAAAATVIGFRAVSKVMGPRTVTMTVDHPFLFLIFDQKTGAIPFFGRVHDPDGVSVIDRSESYLRSSWIGRSLPAAYVRNAIPVVGGLAALIAGLLFWLIWRVMQPRR